MNIALLKKRYNIYIISFILLSALFGHTSFATPACPIITNQFQDANGTTIDAGATGWSLDSSLLTKPHPTGFFFAVTSNRFTATNLGAVGILNSHVFSIAGYKAPQVSVKITAEGDQNSTEYIQFYYKLNGGTPVLVATQTGNFGTLTFTSPTLSGSTVQLIVKIYDYNNGTGTKSNYYIERYDVFQTAGPCTPGSPTITVTPAATNGGALTCTNTSTTLSATSSTTGLSYFWTGPNSFSTTSASPTVSVAGTYNLTVTAATTPTTWGTANVTVTSNISPPASVTATSPTALTCTNTSTTLTATSGTSGATFKWTGSSGFTATGATATTTVPGSYTVTATNPTTGCTATASTTVTQTITPPAGVTITSANNVTQLTCATSYISLTGSSTSSGVSYNWTGPNSFTQTGPIASAFNPGVYTLTVTNPTSSCTSTATITITQNVTLPTGVSVTPSLATLTCSSPSALLTGFSSTTGASYNWTGPNGFTATGITTTAASPGQYILTVTNPADGCTGTAAATISQNFAQPANITAVNSGPLTCLNPIVTLTGNSSTSRVSYNWAGPNNFTSSSAVPTVTTPGTYTLTITDSTNGCTAIAGTVVTQNDTVPAGLLISGNLTNPVLTCANTSITLTASSTTPGVSYNWSGPGGSLSTATAITVNSAGNYSVLATNPVNGCTSSAVTAVTQNITAPASVGVTTIPANSILTCSNPSVSLTGNSSVTGANYSWTGPNGFTSSAGTVAASTPGTYTVTATDPSNGCSSTATGTITQNVSVPTGVAMTSNTGNLVLSCTNPILGLKASSDNNDVNYSWSGPGGFSTAAAATTVTAPGTYTLTATSTTNGCSSTATGIITQDTATPVAIMTSSVPANAVLTCSSPNVVFTGTSGTPGVNYSWSGPNSFTASGTIATASTPGSYVLTVTNPSNGCSSAVTAAAVTQNIIVPVGVTANSSNKLSCFTTSVTLTGNSTTAGATYNWAGPGVGNSSSRVTTATLGGVYTLTVTNPANGCTASKSVTVIADTAAPAGVTAANSGQLTCDITTVTLTGNSTTAGVTYSWTGPNGFFDPEQISTAATDSGEYLLTVSNPGNGCIATAATTVTQDLTACSMVTPKTATGNAASLDLRGDTAAATQFEYKAYPNPASTTAFIEFQSASRSQVSVEVYNNLGIREKTLFNNTVEANQGYKLTFDVSSFTAGIHYCMIRVNNKVYTSKLLFFPNRN